MKHLSISAKIYYFILIICISLISYSPSFGAVEKNTKIVATIGPATESVEKLSELLNNGVNVFRLNFSHASHDYHKKLINNARKAMQITGKNAAILADLQGPKIRIGKFTNDSALLETGAIFKLDLQKNALGNEKRVYFPHPKIIKALHAGNEIYIDDGKIKLKVQQVDDNSVTCKVISGGVLKNNKGVNIPNVVLPVDIITKKDKKDLTFILKQKPDWIALSFVQSEKEIYQVKKLINNSDIKIIAKIETIPSIEEKTLLKIAKAADAIMIARGDLSVEIGPENIAVAEKKIINVMKKAKKPFVVATQMMESMANAIRPYNAEVVDVSYAVYNNADGVMLSGETTVGKYPAETVNMMRAIINSAESSNETKRAKKTYSSDFAGTAAISADCSQSDYVIVRLNDSKNKKEYFDFLKKISNMHSSANVFASFHPKDKANFLLLFRNIYPVYSKIENCSTISDKGMSIAELKNDKFSVSYCKLGK
ncbi:MAG: pyruvate kinase [Rickettsiales bacterium]|nr:pyruvate kinase [Rickettsiales bacterium]